MTSLKCIRLHFKLKLAIKVVCNRCRVRRRIPSPNFRHRAANYWNFPFNFGFFSVFLLVFLYVFVYCSWVYFVVECRTGWLPKWLNPCLIRRAPTDILRLHSTDTTCSKTIHCPRTHEQNIAHTYIYVWVWVFYRNIWPNGWLKFFIYFGVLFWMLLQSSSIAQLDILKSVCILRRPVP